MGAEAQSFSSEAFHTAHTSMQVAVSTEKFLQQEHSVKRYGISFRNMCRNVFIEGLHHPKKESGNANIWQQSKVGEQSCINNYNEKCIYSTARL